MTILPSFLLATALAGPARLPVEEAPPIVSWQELSDCPTRWLGKTVRLRVQFQGRVDSWNPYLTRFGTKRFAAIQAWSDEQFPWVKAEFDTPLVRLFLERGESCAWALDEAHANERFEVTAVVREVFLDVPWTEVLEVRPLVERIGEGTVIHAGKAIDLMKRREWKLAELEIGQAITDSLPARARTELERLRDECRQARIADQRPRRSGIEVHSSD